MKVGDKVVYWPGFSKKVYFLYLPEHQVYKIYDTLIANYDNKVKYLVYFNGINHWIDADNFLSLREYRKAKLIKLKNYEII